jgi:hypothetical protein
VGGRDVGGQADDIKVMAALLIDHAYVPTAARGVSRCACGEQMHGMPHEHRAHFAALLAAHTAQRVADAKAEAWDEGYHEGWEFDGTLGYAPVNPYRERQDARTTPPTTGRTDGQEGEW